MANQLTILTGLGGILIAVCSFVLGNNRQETRARSRVYQRLDEEMNKVDGTFVRKDICDVKYETVIKTLDEMKCDVKKLLKKNGVS